MPAWVTHRALPLLLAALLVAAQPAAASVPQTPRPDVPNRIEEYEFRRAFEAYIRGAWFTARSIWTWLAERGHVGSMNNLGTMYSQGKGVPRDYGAALEWYRRAAALGNARAMYNIAIAYEHGKGVEASDAEAADWYRRAARRGLAEAMDALAWILATSPDPRVRDGHAARRWAEAALEKRISSKRLATLAAAYAELGEYRKAVAAIDRAIDYMKRETNGADMALTGREFAYLLRQAGRTDEMFDLLERREYYANGQPTRD